MFWAFVVLGLYILVMLGVLVLRQDKWNDRWQELAAGSWYGAELEEEKLPPGVYTVSWPRVESHWS